MRAIGVDGTLPRGQTLRYSAAVPLPDGSTHVTATWPPDLDPQTICLTVDVEWASAAVLDDLRTLFDQHGLRATFFVTHAGVDVPGHERGLHPNFRHNGDTYRALTASRP